MLRRAVRRTPDIDVLRRRANEVFSRAAGAPLVGGNHVRILRDAAENYPAWEEAMSSARSTINVEMYVVHHDAVGRRFIDLLASKARQGVSVRLLYDWFGCGFGPMFGLFRPLIKAGGEIRPFNAPTLGNALGWIRRDHRKLITVDGRVAFISGICFGQMWEGRPDKGVLPWRDTGTEIVGPAVAHAEQAFVATWQIAGGRINPDSMPDAATIAAAGDVNLRLISTEPFTATMLRLDLLVTAMARRSLWITDAYFLGHDPFGAALRNAAAGGVDVRLLLPQGSDVGWTVPAQRTLYRTLLESGVRIFEWKGSMIHAKTAVADSQWARVGSTNLNLVSWLGNWELDVAIEDRKIAQTLEQHFLEDLEKSTEIVLAHHLARPIERPVSRRMRARRSARRVVRTVTGLGRSIGAAVTGSRSLEEFEVPPLLVFGCFLLALGVLTFWYPSILAWPLAFAIAWIGISFVSEAMSLWRRRGHE